MTKCSTGIFAKAEVPVAVNDIVGPEDVAEIEVEETLPSPKTRAESCDANEKIEVVEGFGEDGMGVTVD